MRSLFAVGTIFIVCTNNLQAMDPHANKASIDKTNEETNEVPRGPLGWNQDCDWSENALKEMLLARLTDENGNRININSLTDEQLKDLGRKMGETLKKGHCAPPLYNAAPCPAIAAVLSPTECQGITFNRVLLLFEEFRKIEEQEMERYNASLFGPNEALP